MRTLTIAILLACVPAKAGVCPVPTFKVRGVSGQVCFESNTRCVAIPGARVELVDRTGSVISQASADGNGAFRIEPAKAGDFTLKVTANGFHAVECRIVAKKATKANKSLRVVLGSDAILPCGGGRIVEDKK